MLCVCLICFGSGTNHNYLQIFFFPLFTVSIDNFRQYHRCNSNLSRNVKYLAVVLSISTTKSIDRSISM